MLETMLVFIGKICILNILIVFGLMVVPKSITCLKVSKNVRRCLLLSNMFIIIIFTCYIITV